MKWCLFAAKAPLSALASRGAATTKPLLMLKEKNDLAFRRGQCSTELP